MREQTVRTLVLGKWADYRPVLPRASVRFLPRDEYLDAARDDPNVGAELAVGWFEDFDAEFREPVLADALAQVVTVCPPIQISPDACSTNTRPARPSAVPWLAT